MCDVMQKERGSKRDGDSDGFGPRGKAGGEVVVSGVDQLRTGPVSASRARSPKPGASRPSGGPASLPDGLWTGCPVGLHWKDADLSGAVADLF